MTITSASPPGRVDLAAFGLAPEDLYSLHALKVVWTQAVADTFAGSGDDPAVIAFAGETRRLVESLGDVDWQDRWLRQWQKLCAQGFPGSSLSRLLSAALDASEAVLFCGEGPVPRIHVELFSLLRRAVMAIVSCAVDLGEETQLIETGVPGELAAQIGRAHV